MTNYIYQLYQRFFKKEEPTVSPRNMVVGAYIYDFGETISRNNKLATHGLLEKIIDKIFRFRDWNFEKSKSD